MQVKDLTSQLKASKEIIQRLELENQQLKAELGRGSSFGTLKPVAIGSVSTLMVGTVILFDCVWSSLPGVSPVLWHVRLEPARLPSSSPS
jgi:hypothetical protein